MHKSLVNIGCVVFAIYSSIPREQFPRGILVRHVRHALFPRDMSATSSRGCYEDIAPVEFQLVRADRQTDTHADHNMSRKVK